MSPDAGSDATTTSIDELRLRLAALERLLEVARALAAEVEPKQLLRTIAAEACKALVCERASVYRYDAKTDELYTLVATDLEIGEIRQTLDQGISGYCARQRVVINVPDPAADPRWSSRYDRQTGFRTRSILAAPLISSHDQSLLGVLQLLNNADGPFDAFDEELVVAFALHAAVALERVRILEEQRSRDAVEAALAVARDVQRAFMPRQLPEVPGYELASWWFPNQAVGGDFCGVLRLVDGRLGLVIADVAGHGLGPSLLMATARASLRALALEHSAPEQLMNLLAHAIGDDLGEGQFITMILTAIDVAKHSVEFANAGHGPAIQYCHAADAFIELESTGLPLGVVERPEYPQGPPLQLQPGDLLVLCTDGVVESANAAHEPFGVARLERLIRAHRDAPLDALVRTIGDAVSRHFVGDNPPDDLTILAARRSS